MYYAVLLSICSSINSSNVISLKYTIHKYVVCTFVSLVMLGHPTLDNSGLRSIALLFIT